MRIQTEERAIIRKVLHAYFGSQARIILFGSRTNDQARGGDIDLLVETYQSTDNFTRKLQALSELQIALGDQKIDLLIKSPDIGQWPCMDAMYEQVRSSYLARQTR